MRRNDSSIETRTTSPAIRPAMGVPAIVLAIILALAGCAGGASGTGGASKTRGDTRTVRIALGHLRFAPDALTVTAGTTVRFVLVNGDPIDHEFVVGSERVQQEHASAAGMGGMQHGASDPRRVAVPPNKTVEFSYTFDAPGTLIYGCHVEGHYAQGMKGTITVTA